MRLHTLVDLTCVAVLAACSSNQSADTTNAEVEPLDASLAQPNETVTSSGSTAESERTYNDSFTESVATTESPTSGSAHANPETADTSSFGVTSAALGDTHTEPVDGGTSDYDPCVGKECGQPCSLCAESNGDCPADGVGRSCTIDGECRTGAAVCAEPCSSSNDEGNERDGSTSDEMTNEGAHEACLPNGCRPEDARSNGTMCGVIYGYAFDGYACNEVLCGCTGEDCLATADTEQECLERYAVCLARTPECFDDRFPVQDTDPGALPAYPEYGFTVEGYEQLYDEETDTVAVFAEWTSAQWVGWEESTAEATVCPVIPGFAGGWSCPRPAPLVLDVGGETYRVHVSMVWDFPLLSRSDFTDVAIKIEAHASGTLVLRVRDEITGMPVLMVVQSALGMQAQAEPWEFAPFTFSTSDDKFCRTDPDVCGHSFSPLGLLIDTAETQWNLEPLSFKFVKVQDVSFVAFHGYFFNRYSITATSCANEFAPRQSFVLIR